MGVSNEEEIESMTEAFNAGHVYAENEIRTLCPRTLTTKDGKCLELGYDFSQYGPELLIAPVYVATANPNLFLITVFWFIPESGGWKMRGKMGSLSAPPDKDLPAS